MILITESIRGSWEEEMGITGVEKDKGGGKKKINGG